MKWLALAAVLLAEIVAGVREGAPGMAGMALGLGSGSINLALAHMGTKAVAKEVTDAPTGRGALTCGALFLVKLPLILACGFFAFSLGRGAGGCFVVGLLLVYCALFGWALMRSGPL